jgi:hypothetical protein
VLPVTGTYRVVVTARNGSTRVVTDLVSIP